MPVPCGGAFVTKLNADGSAFAYSTYYGGSQTFSNEEVALGIAVSSSGEAYFTGLTKTDDLPVVNPIQANNAQAFTSADIFVAQLNFSGSALLFSTYLGGVGDDVGNDIALDSSGNVYVTGWSGASDFPTSNPLQTTFDGQFSAVFFKIAPDAGTTAPTDESTFVITDRGGTSTTTAGGTGAVAVGYASPHFSRDLNKTEIGASG